MAVEWETPGSRINRENIFVFNKNTKNKKKVEYFQSRDFRVGDSSDTFPSASRNYSNELKKFPTKFK